VLNLAEQVARQTAATKRLEKGLAGLRGDDLAAQVAGNNAAVAELQPNCYRDKATELLRSACRKCPASQTCCVSMAK
jgi:hypothetical protein